MRDRKIKIENIEVFKILHFSSYLALPQTETDGYIQDERQLSMGSEVIRNNARHREVMQQDLHKASLFNVAPCHCVFNPVMSFSNFA